MRRRSPIKKASSGRIQEQCRSSYDVSVPLSQQPTARLLLNRTVIVLGASIFSVVVAFVTLTLVSFLPVEVSNTNSPPDQTSAFQRKVDSTHLPISRRFPRYGTEEFNEACSWLSYDPLSEFNTKGIDESELFNCILLARPSPRSNEGISTWMAEIAVAKIYAVQAGCGVILDYGSGVDVGAILTSPRYRSFRRESQALIIDNNVELSDRQKAQWEIPDGYPCPKSEGCFHVGLRNERMVKSLATDIERMRSNRLKTMEKKFQSDAEVTSRLNELKQNGSLLPTLVLAPHYRFQYSISRDNDVERAKISKLEQSLPHFNHKTGMGCALGSTIDFAATASTFLPSLHSDILPVLRDETNLVIAIYIRTGNTDKMAKIEKQQREEDQNTNADSGMLVGSTNRTFDSDLIGGTKGGRALSHRFTGLTDCALAIEKEQSRLEKYTQSVWLIISDSPGAGQSVKDQFSEQHQNTGSNFKREIITTGALGVQTRPTRSPATKDFAEAALDWMLLGESDVVITTSGFSFAETASLRTARPIFSPSQGGCQRRMLMPNRIEESNSGVEIEELGLRLRDFYSRVP